MKKAVNQIIQWKELLVIISVIIGVIAIAKPVIDLNNNISKLNYVIETHTQEITELKSQCSEIPEIKTRISILEVKRGDEK